MFNNLYALTLVQRHIAHDSQFCVAGCRGVETTHYLFLPCTIFSPLWLWCPIRDWVGTWPIRFRYRTIFFFFQFVYSAGGTRGRRSFMQLLWLRSIWVVWHERNSRIFKAKDSIVFQMLEKVKVHTLWWLKANNTNTSLNYHMWWSNPLVCLGIG
jgi:hypothetical protein